MKRACILFLMLLTFAGCAREKEGTVILTTFYPIYVATLNIAGGIDGVTVEMLAPPDAGCLHDYQLTTADRGRVEAADIVVMNGLGMEAFLDKLLDGKSSINASEGFSWIETAHEGDEHEDDGHGHSSGEPNPHVWVAPEGAIWQAERIRDGLMEFDPDNAALYDANATDYINKLLDLQSAMHASLSPYRGAQIVLQHNSFEYFAKEFQLEVVSVLKSEPEAQLSARELTEAVDAVRANHIPAIFSETQYDDAASQALSRETDVPVYALDSASTGEMDEPDAYLMAMDYNTSMIAFAMGYEP